MFSKAIVSCMIFSAFLSITDPISSFKTWNTEVDSLSQAMGAKNKASAEMVLQVFNSESKNGKRFLKDLVSEFEGQYKDI